MRAAYRSRKVPTFRLTSATATFPSGSWSSWVGSCNCRTFVHIYVNSIRASALPRDGKVRLLQAYTERLREFVILLRDADEP
jgi:hypothetical protein